MEASKNSQSTIGGTDKQPKPVEKFGFDILTYSGYCPLINDWSDNWVVSCFHAFHVYMEHFFIFSSIRVKGCQLKVSNSSYDCLRGDLQYKEMLNDHYYSQSFVGSFDRAHLHAKL